ncbi:MAG: hypothetical protein ABSB09_00900 [Acidimicrobiales bacterium]|jgi:hypothetical protein
MADNRIRIFPKLRGAVDAERLAAALLDLVDHLSADEKSEFIAEGQRALKEVNRTRKAKGSAA